MRKHDIGFPTTEKCLALRCARLNRFISGIFDNALAADGVTSTQLSVLMRIREVEYTTAAHLRSELHMDRSTISKHIKWLKEHGLVETADGIDRRSRRLVLTDLGKGKLRAAHMAWRRAQDRAHDLFGRELTQLGAIDLALQSVGSPRALRRQFRREYYFREEA